MVGIIVYMYKSTLKRGEPQFRNSAMVPAGGYCTVYIQSAYALDAMVLCCIHCPMQKGNLLLV